MTHILRHVQHAVVELFWRATTLRAEHLVDLAEVDDKRMAHQVAAKGNLAGVLSYITKDILQKHGIKHDVAMVGNEKIRLLLSDILHPRPFKSCGGFLQQGFYHIPEQAQLKLRNGLYTTDSFAKHRWRYT